MAKPKESKNAKSHLKARLDFLQQASEYLHQSVTESSSNRAQNEKPTEGFEQPKHGSPGDKYPELSSRMEIDVPSNVTGRPTPAKSLTNLSRMWTSQMRGVSLKSQVRLSIPVKRSFCKRCESVMDFQTTAAQEIQNESKGRKKPWADVRVIRCLVCGTEKRFPLAGTRSQRLALRKKAKEQDQEGPS